MEDSVLGRPLGLAGDGRRILSGWPNVLESRSPAKRLTIERNNEPPRHTHEVCELLGFRRDGAELLFPGMDQRNLVHKSRHVDARGQRRRIKPIPIEERAARLPPPG